MGNFPVLLFKCIMWRFNLLFLRWSTFCFDLHVLVYILCTCIKINSSTPHPPTWDWVDLLLWSLTKPDILCPFHSPHRHYTHSQQPVNYTKPCDGRGQADGLPRYTRQCAGEDQQLCWRCRAAVRWMCVLLEKYLSLLYDWMGLSWREAAMLGTRGCP